MRRLLPIKLLALSCLLAACVTVNVYFPAAAAEQAADRIIDTVTSQPGGSVSNGKSPANDTTPAKTPPNSRVAPKAERPMLLAAAGALLDLLIPAAEAQASPNLDVSDPQIRAVTASMQQRFGDLKKFFDAGVIGLTADGQVAVRDQNAMALADRAVVARLVTEDNRDRATLYAELAKANKHPEWEPDIRRTFARRWVERGAQPGWYYQDAGGKWVQK
ncbi:MAG TPA: YdbL family protein [Steroidobacteraceae bacterium]|nr:YdbL family protein [Steroidobacteraceae bacterium]